METVMKYVAKKKLEAIKTVKKDADGYHVYLHPGWTAGPNATEIHAATIPALRPLLRTIIQQPAAPAPDKPKRGRKPIDPAAKKRTITITLSPHDIRLLNWLAEQSGDNTSIVASRLIQQEAQRQARKTGQPLPD